METESGAKIAIRGKGSVKEGKGKSDAAHASNQDEDLHCLIMADTEDKVNKAKQLIHNVIETVSCSLSAFLIIANSLQAASTPEAQNTLKREQLRELAALNGTLRDDENQACQNCGEIGHRKYDCPQAKNYTASIICRVCGNAGHMARDCPDRARNSDWRNAPPRRPGGDADQEYASIMADISGVPTSGANRQIGWQDSNGYGNGGSGGRPWERTGGNAAPWQQPRQGNSAPWQQRGQGGAAPWQQARGGHDDYSGGYGGNYNSGGQAPWQQNRGNQAPWQQDQGYIPPPPPPAYDAAPPPPPPSDNVPPPPPPPPAD